MKRVYLAGPMRGWIDQNKESFDLAAAQLRRDGYEVFNPPDNPIYGPNDQLNRDACLRLDLRVLVNRSNLVVVLPHWQESPGACLEVAVAWQIGLPVLEWPSMRPIEDTSVSIPREQTTPPHLIGLCGYAGAGKDTVGRVLIEEGWQRYAIGDVLRDLLECLNPLVVASTRVQDVLRRVDGWDQAKREYGELRELLQRLGTEAGRDLLDRQLWIRHVESQIERTPAGQSVVITDVRYPNEARMIWRRGGLLVRVNRPSTNPVNEHVSDNSLTDQDADLILYNSSSEADLQLQAKKLIDALRPQV